MYVYIFPLSCIDGNRIQQHLSEFLCLQATSLKQYHKSKVSEVVHK